MTYKLILTEYVNILTVLIILDTSCLIILIGIGLFIRVHDKFVNYLGSEDNFPSEIITQKIFLGIWIAAICFFSSTVCYGLF